jgi:hypothetical protein
MPQNDTFCPASLLSPHTTEKQPHVTYFLYYAQCTLTHTHNFVLCQFLFLGNENVSRQTSESEREGASHMCVFMLLTWNGNLKIFAVRKNVCVCARESEGEGKSTQFSVYIDIVMQYADRKFAFNGHDRRTVEFPSLHFVCVCVCIYIPTISSLFMCCRVGIGQTLTYIERKRERGEVRKGFKHSSGNRHSIAPIKSRENASKFAFIRSKHNETINYCRNER